MSSVSSKEQADRALAHAANMLYGGNWEEVEPRGQGYISIKDSFGPEVYDPVTDEEVEKSPPLPEKFKEEDQDDHIIIKLFKSIFGN